MRIRKREEVAQLDNKMTAMIDIVFLLLVFFVMTFKIVLPEGDFNVNMPAPADGPPEVVDIMPPVRVKLQAAENGQLSSIQMGNRAVASIDALRAEVQQMLTADTTELEVELDCDQHLHYRHVVEAITAVTGYRNENGEVVDLVKKVRFTPPR